MRTRTIPTPSTRPWKRTRPHDLSQSTHTPHRPDSAHPRLEPPEAPPSPRLAPVGLRPGHLHHGRGGHGPADLSDGGLLGVPVQPVEGDCRLLRPGRWGPSRRQDPGEAGARLQRRALGRSGPGGQQPRPHRSRLQQGQLPAVRQHPQGQQRGTHGPSQDPLHLPGPARLPRHGRRHPAQGPGAPGGHLVAGRGRGDPLGHHRAPRPGRGHYVHQLGQGQDR